MLILRFKLASGLGEPWTRDGGYSSWLSSKYDVYCCSLFAMVSVFVCSGWSSSQLYADNLKCVSHDPDSLLAAARFTTGYVRLVGQEPAPSKCVLLSTSREI